MDIMYKSVVCMFKQSTVQVFVSSNLLNIWNQFVEKNISDGDFSTRDILILRGHPNNKIHGANMGPIWGQRNPGGPHVGPMNFAIWAAI